MAPLFQLHCVVFVVLAAFIGLHLLGNNTDALNHAFQLADKIDSHHFWRLMLGNAVRGALVNLAASMSAPHTVMYTVGAIYNACFAVQYAVEYFAFEAVQGTLIVGMLAVVIVNGWQILPDGTRRT